jgi:hypothetical protein
VSVSKGAGLALKDAPYVLFFQRFRFDARKAKCNENSRRKQMRKKKRRKSAIRFLCLPVEETLVFLHGKKEEALI